MRKILFLLFLFSAHVFAAPASTRGLETSGLDEFVVSLNGEKFSNVQDWFQRQGFIDLAEYTASLVHLPPKTGAELLARRIFNEQMRFRSHLKVGGDMAAERRRMALLQALLEESVLFAAGSEEKTMVFQGYQLSDREQALSSSLLGLRVVPGDIAIQIGSQHLSSHFIAHSQAHPGLASHSYMIYEGGESPKIVEALIEDGVNRRLAEPKDLTRLWVLSLKSEGERTKAGEAAKGFIDEYGIPFVKQGQTGPLSPLRYDSTMNPDRRREKSYFCTAVVMDIYQRASFGEIQIPYLANRANWNSVGDLEKLIYRSLDISADQVPAPSDVLMQPEFVVRGLYVSANGIRQSRRLRAVVDAFFDLLQSDAQVRRDILAALEAIPRSEVSKADVIAWLDRLAASPGPVSAEAVRKMKEQVQASLPQTANLRQIAFFFSLNFYLQDRGHAELRDYEENQLGRRGTPGELRAKAAQWLRSEVVQVEQILMHK